MHKILLANIVKSNIHGVEITVKSFSTFFPQKLREIKKFSTCQLHRNDRKHFSQNSSKMRVNFPSFHTVSSYANAVHTQDYEKDLQPLFGKQMKAAFF